MSVNNGNFSQIHFPSWDNPNEYMDDLFKKNPKKVLEIYLDPVQRNGRYQDWFKHHLAEVLKYREKVVEEFVLPILKYKGQTLIYVAENNLIYLGKIITNPDPKFSLEVRLWVDKYMNRNLRSVPFGKYGGKYYAHVLEIDPRYIYDILSNEYPILTQHAKRWIDSAPRDIRSKFIKILNAASPQSKKSFSEKLCGYVLWTLGIKYDKEFKTSIVLSGFSKPARFDFKFDYRGRIFVLEMDGRQHFEITQKFNRTQKELTTQKNRDITKMKYAMNKGYNIIRISSDCANEIRRHIEFVLNNYEPSSQIQYYSDENYEEMIDRVDEIHEENNPSAQF